MPTAHLDTCTNALGACQVRIEVDVLKRMHRVLDIGLAPPLQYRCGRALPSAIDGSLIVDRKAPIVSDDIPMPNIVADDDRQPGG